MTSKRRDGAAEASDTVTSLVSMLQGPAANSLVVSQRLAIEAARFWARRMHAYADQMEALVGCASADDVAVAQTRFIERMRDDYVAESEALGSLLTQPPSRTQRGNGQRADA